MLQWEVSADESGIPLLTFLQKKLGFEYSGRFVKKLLEKSLCTVNLRTERFGSSIVGTGDKITLAIDDPAQIAPSQILIDPSKVVFEDNHLLIYSKPAGIASDNEKLHAVLMHGKPYLGLVHRLDRDTSGALIFAKSQKAFDGMLSLFKKRLINKEYLAIVDGVPQDTQGLIDNYLGEVHRYQGQTIWGEVEQKKGLQAITAWKCERRGKDAALLRCFPKTGRTHQIRVHLSGIGHPILGDHQYGKKFRCSYRPTRCMLHASVLSFPHPCGGNEVKIRAPLPEDFRSAVEHLFGDYEDFNR